MTPKLVVDVSFTERTRDGLLRHPVFRGIREDKSPEEVTMAEPDPDPAEAGRASRARANRGAGESRRKPGVQVAGVPLSNPGRVLYPEQGVTKLALAEFYEDISDWVLPGLECRPLALVRCPSGRGGSCFYQKHPGEGNPQVVRRIEIEEKEGTGTGLYVDSLAGLVALVQMGVLELHVWGCRIEAIEKPDLMVFDLDPDEGIAWATVVAAARSLMARLEDLGLPVFVRLTGGKGVHLVVPLQRGPGWEEMKAFSRAVAEAHSSDAPKDYTTNPQKVRRKGRIFIDYLRNGRGATAIASYSTRARPGAPVAVPIRADELSGGTPPDRYTVANLRRRLSSLAADPWEDFEEARARLTKTMMKAVGMKP